jgi:hypothetical protein
MLIGSLVFVCSDHFEVRWQLQARLLLPIGECLACGTRMRRR